jgi:hypothetical protein
MTRAGIQETRSGEVLIKGNEVSAVSPEGQRACMDLETFLEVLPRFNGQPFEHDWILPDGIKLVKSKGSITVLVYERPPQVHSLKWIARDSPAPFGRGTKYRTVRIALPYLIILASFERVRGACMQLSKINECFFRKAPLKSLEDELFYPALLNCSKIPIEAGRPLSWICTTKMNVRAAAGEREDNQRMREGVRALLHCLFETGYNHSSEHHEGSSWFTESTGVDPRISTIEEWEKATAREPLFVLDVPWLKTGMTLQEAMERLFRLGGAHHGRVSSAADLMRILFNHAHRR